MSEDIAKKLRDAHYLLGRFMEVPWLLKAAEEIELLRSGNGWQDISTAPDDVPHIRGLWVRHRPTGKVSWHQRMGFIDDETGEFVDELGQDFGWAAEDYEMWHAQPLPPPPSTEGE